GRGSGEEDHRRRRGLVRCQAEYRQVRPLHLFRWQPQRCVLFRLRRNQEPIRHQRQTELHRTSSWRQVAMDRRGFEHRGERGFDRDRAADGRTTDRTREEYNASEPVNDRKRWLEQFIHLMGHTGNYTREEAIAAIDKEGTLPDVLSFDPSKPAKYPNGRVFTDDVIDYRLAFLT